MYLKKAKLKDGRIPHSASKKKGKIINETKEKRV